MTAQTAAFARPSSPVTRYRRSLWLLTTRDLKVRYSTSFLGYVWSILDPLLMAGIYFFVFTMVFERTVGERPYIVFLLCGLLPWMWFSGAISDSTVAFTREAKLIRSTTIPRTIWVVRLMLSKGLEFAFSLPVLAAFAIGASLFGEPVQVGWEVLLFPLGVLLQAGLIVGVGLIIAPMVVFFRDLERATKLVLRFTFYASPIIYGLPDLADLGIHRWAALNPLAGIIGIYRSAFFPGQLDWYAVGMSAGMTAIVLLIGAWVFRRSIRTVLKEI